MQTRESDTGKLLQEIFSGYAKSVGLNPDARYLFGTPIRPVVPLDHGVGAVCFLGAYPSARFIEHRGVSDVPAGDNLGPFENERWFDGRRVRVQPSARELNDYFLAPLGLNRAECWITDLVKVFLFKDGHARKYTELGVTVPVGYERKRFGELGVKSLPWLEREIALAKPKLLITLGAEVAGVVRGVHAGQRQVELLKAQIEEIEICGMHVATIHCAHPGILMRPSMRNPWPERHVSEFLPTIRAYLATERQ